MPVLLDINNRHADYRRLAEELDAWREGDAAGEQVRTALHLGYPNVYDWKLLTARTAHFRSGKFFGGADSLVNVDTAIAAYQANPTGANRNALRTAFDAWAAANKKEVRERDVAVNGEAEGCITKLRNWLHADRSEPALI